MTESTTSVEEIEPQVHEDVNEEAISRITIGRGISPKGFDIVVCSYDQAYSGTGPLHKYIARELELDGSEMSIFIEEKYFRVWTCKSSSSTHVLLLCQVVSIFDGPNNALNLEANLIDLFHHLILAIDEREDFMDLQLNRMWIPTLGTGSAGLSQKQSAQVIARSLDETGNGSSSEHFVIDITIAPPEFLDDDVYQQIVEEFTIITRSSFKVVDWDATSEMPGQFHSDHALADPADDDLGRDAIAATIVTNVQRVWREHSKKNEERPFVIHLSGRWGSGKSSILGFLEKRLVKEVEHHREGWVVVNYNAWRMQEAGPAWWSLLTTVREQGYSALGTEGLWPRFTDWLWRVTRVAWPWIATLLVIVLLIGLYQLKEKPGSKKETITTIETLSNSDKVKSTKKTVESESPPKSFFNSENSGAFVLTMVAALGSFGALAKLIQSWGKSASETAEAVRALQSDPTATVKERFEHIVGNIDRPVAVFIDDLDRCDARFVVELLQSLQTAYSNVAVLYVIASDRDWIVSAYNQVYDGFVEDLSKPGAPLGYLFVKKIFQLSVSIPDLTQSDRTRLTQVLLDTETNPINVTLTRDERVEEIRKAASSGNLNQVREIQAAALSEGQNLADEVMSAVSSAAGQIYLRHKLLDYTEDFDGNPRAIKRLINALTFRQGYILTAAEDISFDHIVRWTILTLRFPYTAELLAVRPETKVPDDATDEFPEPKEIESILGEMTPADITKIASFG